MKRTLVMIGFAALLIGMSAPAAQAQNSLQVTNVRPAGTPGIVGAYSMEVSYDPVAINATYVQSNDPTDETVHRINVLTYLDTNAGADDWVDGDKHQVVKVRQLDPSPATVWRVHIRKITQNDATSEYRAVLWCNSGGTMTPNQEFVAEFYLIDNAWQEFGFEWAAESAPGAGDGVCQMWKAGNYAGRRGSTTMTGTSAYNVDVQFLGAFDYAVHNGTYGSMFWDNFESYRTLAP